MRAKAGLLEGGERRSLVRHQLIEMLAGEAA